MASRKLVRDLLLPRRPFFQLTSKQVRLLKSRAWVCREAKVQLFIITIFLFCRIRVWGEGCFLRVRMGIPVIVDSVCWMSFQSALKGKPKGIQPFKSLSLNLWLRMCNCLFKSFVYLFILCIIWISSTFMMYGERKLWASFLGSAILCLSFGVEYRGILFILLLTWNCRMRISNYLDTLYAGLQKSWISEVSEGSQGQSRGAKRCERRIES